MDPTQLGNARVPVKLPTVNPTGGPIKTGKNTLHFQGLHPAGRMKHPKIPGGVVSCHETTYKEI